MIYPTIFAFVLGGVAVWLYEVVTGCNGSGHHYGDSPTDVRIRTTPHANTPKYTATVVKRYKCQHDGCYSETTETAALIDLSEGGHANLIRDLKDGRYDDP